MKNTTRSFLLAVCLLITASSVFAKERKPIYDFKRNMVSISADVGSTSLQFKNRLPNVALGWSIKMGKSNFYFLHNIQFMNNYYDNFIYYYYSNSATFDNIVSRIGNNDFRPSPLIKHKVKRYSNTFATDFNAVYSFYKLMKVRWFDIHIGAGLFVNYTYENEVDKYKDGNKKIKEISSLNTSDVFFGEKFNTGVSALIKTKFLITKNVDLFMGIKIYQGVLANAYKRRNYSAGNIFTGITYNF